MSRPLHLRMPDDLLMAAEARRDRPLRREPRAASVIAFEAAHARMVEEIGEREAYCITARLAHLNPSREQGVDRRALADAKFREVVG